MNNVNVSGSIMCYSDMWTHWRPSTMEDITPDSLAFVDLIHPAPELVLLGCGLVTRPLSKSLHEFFQSRNLAYEALDTVRQSCPATTILLLCFNTVVISVVDNPPRPHLRVCMQS